MNILMVTERYIPIWGGAENQLRQLIPHLEERGCNIRIVTRRWHNHFSKKEIVDGVEVSRLGVPGAGFFSTLIFLQSLIFHIVRNKKNIDILHSHGAVKMGALCAFLAILLRKKNVAKIATAGKIPALRSEILGRLNLWLFKLSSAIIAMTKEIEDELKAINIPVDRIIRITNGVDTHRFVRGKKLEREQWRTEQGISHDTIVVLFSSRLVYRKGLDILLRAWPEVNQDFPDSILMILGSGTDQPDSVEAEMKKFVNSRQIKNIHFLGESDHPELFLSLVDIFVFPSRKEGFPNALMEAMSSGLLVVASNIGGVTPLVKDSETGFVFEADNELDLADKLKTALNDMELVEKVGKNARISMSENFSFGKIASSYCNLYSRLTPNTRDVL